MAVGDATLPVLLPIVGIEIGVACAGIKSPQRKDLVIFNIAKGSRVAGVFTNNKFSAAPVVVARKHLQQSNPRYLIVNTGNANAGTGAMGLRDAISCCRQLALSGHCETSEVLPFSTGVIGEPLPVELILNSIDDSLADIRSTNWAAAAEGIMTTDTRPKGASLQVDVAGVPVTITGICKGAGMIRPDMATMLAFVGTDASISGSVLRQLVTQAVASSFNRITVDSDTSTNDACLLMATGKAAVDELRRLDDPQWQPFIMALNKLFISLAQAIVRDAEGATKFIEILVEDAESSESALEVAYTIAHSPLVKTAFFASDPNWGRILAAIGRACVPDLDVDRVSIWLNDTCIVRHGTRAEDYDEAAGQRVMALPEILVRVNLAAGNVSEIVWTSDLSHEYVRINSEYRT